MKTNHKNAKPASVAYEDLSESHNSIYLETERHPEWVDIFFFFCDFNLDLQVTV